MGLLGKVKEEIIGRRPSNGIERFNRIQQSGKQISVVEFLKTVDEEIERTSSELIDFVERFVEEMEETGRKCCQFASGDSRVKLSKSDLLLTDKYASLIVGVDADLRTHYHLKDALLFDVRGLKNIIAKEFLDKLGRKFLEKASEKQPFNDADKDPKFMAYLHERAIADNKRKNEATIKED